MRQSQSVVNISCEAEQHKDKKVTVRRRKSMQETFTSDSKADHVHESGEIELRGEKDDDQAIDLDQAQIVLEHSKFDHKVMIKEQEKIDEEKLSESQKADERSQGEKPNGSTA